ncbi:MAG: hypothetical protein V1678_03675, partial [Candidatus Aenigmatarchaeota archaeon]
NSNSEQKCYAEGFTCGGTGTCVVDVSGEKSKMLTWKSTCGGYAYTVMDGNNEYAEFNCQVTTTPVSISTTNQTFTSTQICMDSDWNNHFLKGFVESGVDTFRHTDYDTCWVINSDTDYHAAPECTGANCYVLEGECSESQTQKSVAWKCPYDCKDGACVQKEEVKEQVQCRFLNSDVLTQPTSAKPYEKCYAVYSQGSLGPAVQCTSDGNVAEENGKRYLYCMADATGEQGTKITWKSSCGGYAYTVMDGNNEYVEFTCVPSLNVTAQQISGKGFKYAYWQCYDGVEQKTFDPSAEPCQSSESWQRTAADYCKNHCYADGSKCGVNSFSLSQECYVDAEKSAFIPAVTSVEAPQATQPTQATAIKAEEAILICKDSCPSEGKCYPFGYRKGEKYCSDEGAFKGQLNGNAVCENNFECSTNVCVDGKCISSNFIQMIIDWFKKLFGSV